MSYTEGSAIKPQHHDDKRFTLNQLENKKRLSADR